MAMAGSSVTIQDALTALNLNNDPGATNTFATNGIPPTEIINHRSEKEYVMLGVTPKEFIEKHSAGDFDFAKLQEEFKEICLDYLKPLVLDEKSKAVEFCSKIIYEVGPETRRVKKADGDKIWKFRFLYNENGKLVVKTAFVCTFKSSTYVPFFDRNKIVLTIKQASLLAIVTFCSLAKLAVVQTPPVYLLTPLAGAVFSKEDVPNIHDAIPRSRVTDIICAINTSCQSGGHYLTASRLHVAYISAIVATAGMKNQETRHQILSKTVKQYLSKKKTWKPDMFAAYSLYAHGGVPEYLRPEKMIKLFKDLQSVEPTVREAAKSALQTAVSSVV